METELSEFWPLVVANSVDGHATRSGSASFQWYSSEKCAIVSPNRNGAVKIRLHQVSRSKQVVEIQTDGRTTCSSTSLYDDRALTEQISRRLGIEKFFLETAKVLSAVSQEASAELLGLVALRTAGASLGV